MNDINDQELIERVEKAVKRQKLIGRWTAFGANFLFYLLALIMVVANLSNPESSVGNIPTERLEVFIVPMGLWLLALLIQLSSTLMDSGVMDKEFTSKFITQELGQRFMQNKLQSMSEKLKREDTNLNVDHMTINDEGELVSLTEAEDHQRISRS